jgi:hypothetical protein
MTPMSNLTPFDHLVIQAFHSDPFPLEELIRAAIALYPEPEWFPGLTIPNRKLPPIPDVAALIEKHFGQYTGTARYTILSLDDIGRRIYFARMADELDPAGNRLKTLNGIIRRAKTADV